MKTCTTETYDPSVLRGRTVAVIGYGNQGRAHALNLRDSGFHVVVGQRPGSANFERAREDGIVPVSARAAASGAALVILALPDESMAEVWRGEIAPALSAGAALGFVHGFNIRFGWIDPPAECDVILVAPKGPGRLVRAEFERGRGVPAMIAVHRDATGLARDRALAWAHGIGAGRAAIIETTFADETEADLFGEQAVLCGGVIELMKTGFETLVEAGYAPELAYFECVHEVKQIVDLVYEAGLAGMRRRISTTAQFGGLTAGPRVVNDAVRAEMRQIFSEIRGGRFAERWRAQCASGRGDLARLLAAEASHPAEQAGATVRAWAGEHVAGVDCTRLK